MTAELVSQMYCNNITCQRVSHDNLIFIQILYDEYPLCMASRDLEGDLDIENYLGETVKYSSYLSCANIFTLTEPVVTQCLMHEFCGIITPE